MIEGKCHHPVLAAACSLMIIGCQTPARMIEVMDYPTGAEPLAYHQEFDTCIYRKSPDGSLDVIAQRLPKAGDTPAATASQTLQLHVFFDPIPSRSPSDPTMTNALVNYLVVGDGATCSFDGGGFVSWKQDQFGDEITIYLERAALQPQRVLDDSTPIFERPRVTGKLTATRDDRRVVSLLNDLRRTFGPLPDDKPPITDPRLR